MANNADLRQAITIAVGAENTDAVGRLRSDILGLESDIQKMRTAQDEGSVSNAVAEKSIASYVRQIKVYRDAIVALREEEGRVTRFRAEMAAENERYLENQAKAAKESVDQQIADYARLQTALGAMEARDRNDTASGVASPRVAQAITDATKIYDAEADLQAKLKQMQQQAATEAADGARTTAAARRQGTEAVVDHIAAVKREMDAEEEARVAAIKAMGDRARAYARAEQAADATKEATQKAAQAATTNANAKTWMDKQKGDLDALLADMHEYEKVAATVQYKAAPTRQQIDATNAATEAQKRHSYALLNVSHAAQDAMFGFGAVLNNIPLVTQSVISANPQLEKMADKFGGAAGIAGGAMLAGVAIDLLIRQFGPAVTQWVRESGLMAEATYGVLEGVKKLEDELKALDAKPYKSRIDYRDIDIATEKLRKLREDEASYERLKNKQSKDQQERGQRTTDAIVEHGGGDDMESSVEKIVDALKTLVPTVESAATQGAKARVGQINEDLASHRIGDPEVIADMMRERASLTSQIKDLQAEDESAARGNIQKRVGRAGRGVEADRAWLEQMTRGNGGAFARQGVGPGFLDALMDARPDTIAAEKTVEEAAAAKKAADELRRKQEAEKKKVDDEKKKVGDEAARIEKERIAGVEAAISVVDQDFAARSRDAAARYGPRMNDKIEEAMLKRLDQGQREGRVVGDLAGQATAALKGEGVDAGVAREAGKMVAQKAFDAVMTEATRAGSPREALAVRQDKWLTKLDADQNRAGNLADRQGNRVARDQRQGAKDDKAAAQADLAAQFQAMHPGANNLVAWDAGKRALAKMEKGGGDSNQALEAVFREMMLSLNQQQQQNQRLGQLANGWAQNIRVTRRQQGRMGVQQPAMGNVTVPMGGFGP